MAVVELSPAAAIFFLAMPLVTLTEELLRDRLTDGELEAFDTSAVEDGATAPDRIDGILKSVADEVAGYVEGCRRNPRIERGVKKVPQELVGAALSIARHQLGAALPNMGGLIDELRVSEYRQAYSTLERTSACDLILDADWTPDTDDQTTNYGGTWGGDRKINFDQF